MHDSVTDGSGRNLAIVLRLEDVDHILDQHGNLFGIDRPLVTRGADGVEQLLPGKFLASSVAFDDGNAVADETLGRAIPVAAFETLTATADG